MLLRSHVLLGTTHSVIRGYTTVPARLPGRPACSLEHWLRGNHTIKATKILFGPWKTKITSQA